jgi:hypothetical protein
VRRPRRGQGVISCYLVIFHKRIIPVHDRRVRTVTTNSVLAPYRMSGVSAAHNGVPSPGVTRAIRAHQTWGPQPTHMGAAAHLGGRHSPSGPSYKKSYLLLFYRYT